MTIKISTANPLVRQAVYNAYGGKCLWTGRDVSFNEMRIDHIKPKVKGGEDKLENYALSSKEANAKKLDKLDEQALAPVLYYIKIHFLPKMNDELARLINKKAEDGEGVKSKKRVSICPAAEKPRGILTLANPEIAMLIIVLNRFLKNETSAINRLYPSCDLITNLEYAAINKNEFNSLFPQSCFESISISVREKSFIVGHHGISALITSALIDRGNEISYFGFFTPIFDARNPAAKYYIEQLQAMVTNYLSSDLPEELRPVSKSILTLTTKILAGYNRLPSSNDCQIRRRL